MNIFAYRLIVRLNKSAGWRMRFTLRADARTALACPLPPFRGFSLRGKAFTVLLLSVFAMAPTFAQLTFESTRVQLEGKFGEGQLDAAYPFENKSERTVTVQEVTSGCGCTVPELAQKTYAPGEKGVLRAVFSAGQRQGEQRQTITVKTDAGDQVLRLIVHLPVRLDIAPRILLFRVDETKPKAAVLTFAEDLPVTVESVTVSDTDTFTLVGEQWLEPLVGDAKPAKQVFRIEVQPTGAGGAKERALVQIRSKGASGTIYNDYLHLRRLP